MSQSGNGPPQMQSGGMAGAPQMSGGAGMQQRPGGSQSFREVSPAQGMPPPGGGQQQASQAAMDWANQRQVSPPQGGVQQGPPGGGYSPAMQQRMQQGGFGGLGQAMGNFAAGGFNPQQAAMDQMRSMQTPKQGQPPYGQGMPPGGMVAQQMAMQRAPMGQGGGLAGAARSMGGALGGMMRGDAVQRPQMPQGTPMAAQQMRPQRQQRQQVPWQHGVTHEGA